MIHDSGGSVPHSPKTKRPIRVYILGVFILLSGMVIGAGLMSFVLWNNLQKPMRHFERMPDRIVEDMKSHIDLSDEQAERIGDVFQRHLAAFDSIRQEVEPKVNREITLIETEIRGILTQEQQEQWENRYMKFRRRWFPGPPRPYSRHGDERSFKDKSPPRHDRRSHHYDPHQWAPPDSGPPESPDQRRPANESPERL